MGEDIQKPAAGVDAAKPEGGSPAPAADGKGAAPPESKDEERIQLRQRAIEAERKLEKFVAQQKTEQEKRDAEQGNWQKLAQERERERDDYRGKWVHERKATALANAAHKVRVKPSYTSAVLKLASLPDDVNVDDLDALGTVAEKVVRDLAAGMPDLFESETKADVKDKTANTKPAPPGGGRPAIDPNRVYTAAEISAMSKEDFAALQKSKGNGVGRDIYGRPLG